MTKAEFCYNLKIAPSEYDQMTMAEIMAFVRTHNAAQERS